MKMLFFRWGVLVLLSLGMYVDGVGTEPTSAYNAYFDLLKAYPATLGPDGSWRDGEIEILRDPKRMAEIENKTGRKVGIIAQDKYWLWLNDAVKFPSGADGVYGRMLWVNSLYGKTGVAVMAVLPGNRIVLNCNYRHATRSWELELPRGTSNKGEEPADTARREVAEETGMVIDQLVLLGEMAVDTGFTNAVASIFFARVVDQRQAAREDSEAIESILALSVKDVLAGVKKGEMSVSIQGKERLVKLRDPFLTNALLQAHLQGMIE